MNIGIEKIGSYIPSGRISNFSLKDKFDIDDNFINKRIGIKQVAVRDESDLCSDLCLKAFDDLKTKIEVNLETIDAVCVVTQNPDRSIPHVSAVVHSKLGLPSTTACFDISHGCSGYIYGLSIIQGFLKESGLKRALLFTSDPYSTIIDREDKSTTLLFGDGATVSLIGPNYTYATNGYSFGSLAGSYDDLSCNSGVLHMNGRGIFNFAAKHVPLDILGFLDRKNKTAEDIDLFLLHQGSKYIVDTLTRKLKLDPAKVPFDVADYGNTVSSSIPLMLKERFEDTNLKSILVCGFGVGLSWGTSLLERN